jgi:outer membrane lipoprotein-sorting protein
MTKLWVSVGLGFLYLLIWQMTAHAFQHETAMIIENFKKSAKRINTISAEYENSRSTYMYGMGKAQTEIRSGKIYFARKNKMKMEQHVPTSELVICSNGYVWWVRHQKNRVDYYPDRVFSQQLSIISLVLQSENNINDFEKYYNIKQVYNSECSLKQDGVELLLKPKPNMPLQIRQVVLWLEPKKMIVQGVRISITSKKFIEYKFINIKINKQLPKNLFKYSPPSHYMTHKHIY